MQNVSPAISDSELQLLQLGLRPYSEVWELQKVLQKKLIALEGRETLISCQHTPVITLGKSTKEGSLLASEDLLRSNGIELFLVERGGDATYHGPGQLVLYPILDLRNRKQDVDWYMRALEEVVIRTLLHYRIKAFRIPGRTGVWTQQPENDRDLGSDKAAKKIASLGVRLSRWCTMHGIALNVKSELSGFSYIHPCGYTDVGMTSMESEASREYDLLDVEKILLDSFLEQF